LEDLFAFAERCEDFAGMWIDHEAQVVELLFVGGGEEHRQTLERLLGAPEHLRLADATYRDAELRAVRRRIPLWSSIFSEYTDPRRNRVVIGICPYDEEVARALRARLGAAVIVEKNCSTLDAVPDRADP